MEPTLVTETSGEKTQTPGKFPEESTLLSQRGESLKTLQSFSHKQYHNYNRGFLAVKYVCSSCIFRNVGGDY
jgi:hypothetical protein